MSVDQSKNNRNDDENWESLAGSDNQPKEAGDLDSADQGRFDQQFYELTQGLELDDSGLSAEFEKEFAGFESKSEIVSESEAKSVSTPEADLDSVVNELLCNAVIVAPVSFRLIRKIVKMLAKQGIDVQVQPVRLSPVSGLFMRVWKTPENMAEHEMDELLGEERPMPREVDLLASALSASGVPVVAVASWLTDPDGSDAQSDEEALEMYGELGVTGVITACQYRDGKATKFFPGGMILSHFDPKLEDLLLGDLDPNDVEES